MELQSRQHISGDEATELIIQGLPLINMHIHGEIKIIAKTNWDKDIIIDNCIVDFFNGATVIFENPVKITNSHFKNSSFYSAYFLKGLIIENSSFDEYLDFQCCGHNEVGHPIILNNNTFSSFVNFWDCWFTGEIVVSSNKFVKGTNIESEELFMKFAVTASIRDNFGQTNINADFIE